jgi:hypothetical protein
VVDVAVHEHAEDALALQVLHDLQRAVEVPHSREGSARLVLLELQRHPREAADGSGEEQ